MDKDIYSSFTDEELAEMVRSEGHRRRTLILAELFSRYFGFLKSRTAQLCDDPGEYEDLLHEGMAGFIKAVDSFDAGKEKRRFFPFMYACVSNRITDALRRRRDDCEEAEAGEEMSPEMRFIIREMIEDALSMLSPLEAEVLLLRYAGHSYSEAGDKLSVSEKAAENAAARAHHKLRLRRIS